MLADAKKYGMMIVTIAIGVAVLSRIVPGVGVMVGLRPMPLFPNLPFPLGFAGRQPARSASASAAAPADDYRSMADSLLA